MKLSSLSGAGDAVFGHASTSNTVRPGQPSDEGFNEVDRPA
jgi:hypothetical protein